MPSWLSPRRSMRLTKVDERKILDFDIENRPLAYWYGDATTGEITAIAWSWVGDKKVHVRALGENTMEDMLSDFVEVFQEADMVTGHYIRMHDLPVLNGALVEHKMRPLPPKLTSDTKLDLVKVKHLAVSQEALGAMLGIEAPKVGMNQVTWREANRLTPAGIKLTKERVVGDVVQHKLMRAELLRLGLLRVPRMWYTVPGGLAIAEL